MMTTVSITLTLLLFYSYAYAFQVAELRTETAEELLLFFEEEELMIATKHVTQVSKAPAIATVVTAKEIRNMGARNLFDILRKSPGIGVIISDVPVLRSVEVRGIRTTTSEKVLIMIDGHRMNIPVNGGAVWNFGDLPVENIKRVEIIRGPGSALYGENAYAAVINVVTKSAEEIKGVHVTTGGGSFNTEHYNVQFGHNKNKLSATGFFDYLYTDGPSSEIDQDITGAAGMTDEWEEKYDIGLNIAYGDLSLRTRYFDIKTGPYIGVAHALSDESKQKQRQFIADVIYETHITDSLDISARIYGDYSRQIKYWELFPEGYAFAPLPAYTYPDGVLGSPSGKSSRLGGDASLNYALHDHVATAGVMYEHDRSFDNKRMANFNPLTYVNLGPYQDITSWGNYTQDADRDIWAAYLQDIWGITDSASLTAGVRYDRYSDFGGTTNPRAGFVWEFIQNTSLKLLYGSAFRAPSFAELYYINNPVSVGNPDLKAEKIRTYEAGLEHRFLENYTLRLNYFYNELKDLIALGEKPSVSEPARWENRGSAEVRGVEAELLYDFGNDNYGLLNYSYQHPVDADTGHRLPDVPAHRANAIFNFAPWMYVNANIGVSWIGQRYRADEDTRDDLPADTLVDLTLIAKNLFRTLEIRGSVYNVFDEDYRDPSPYPGQVPNDYPANRRMFLIEARYTF